MGNSNNKSSDQVPRRNQRLNLRNIFRYRRNSVHSHGTLVPTKEHSGECPVCCEPYEILLHYSSCTHLACALCWLTFICTELESFAMSRLTCIGCKKALSAHTVINMLTQAIRNPEAYGLGSDPPLTDTTAAADQPDAYFPSLIGNCGRMLSRFDEFLLRRVLSSESDTRWCPGGCGYGLIAQGYAACPQIPCERPECNIDSFCYNCQRPWSSTDSAGKPSSHVCPRAGQNDLMDGLWAILGLQQVRRRNSVLSDTTPTIPSGHTPTSPIAIIYESEENATDRLQPVSTDDDHISGRSSSSGDPSSPSVRRSSESNSGPIKPCPRCGSLIQKLNDGSCNDMNCSICGLNFCWLCLRENKFGHYLTLSGCTMWGQQQWSRRKRFVSLIIIMLCTPIVLPLLLALGIPIGIVAFIAFMVHFVCTWASAMRKPVKILLAILAALLSCIIAPVFCTLIGAITLVSSIGFLYFYLPVHMLISFVKKPDSPPVPSNLFLFDSADPSNAA